MTKIIGLTGGIGSGKSTVAKYFQTFGIPVYIADEQAKIIAESPEIVQAVKINFGDEIFENEKLNREKLSQIVFNNPEKLKQLNAIIHPAVKKDFDLWVKTHANEPYLIKETAILFESGSYKDCDFIITVTAPLETRIRRVIKRDGTTREKVLKRIENQWTDAERIAKSKFIIENINLDNTKIQIENILKKFSIQ
jgi:dephospho-CoA kinase